MTQERFSSLKILNSLKERTARLSLVNIANKFAGRNDDRKSNFGSDTQLYQPLPRFF